MKKIILQRAFQGQDSWGAFKEQVTIDVDSNLNYRRTEGGNCNYGEWEEFQGEEIAILFIFGDLPVSGKLLTEFKKVAKKAEGLKENEFNMDCY